MRLRSVLGAAIAALLLAAAPASAVGVEVSGLGPDRYFSPNGDGWDDGIGVSYSLATAAHVSIVVRTGAGARVRLIEANASHPDGGQSFSWDGRDDGGAQVPDGVYDYTISSEGTGGETDTASGRIGVESQPPGEITAPHAGDTLASIAQYAYTPRAGVKVKGVYFCVVALSCQQVFDVSSDGSWRTSGDTLGFPDGPQTVMAGVEYEDAFGQPHSLSRSLTVTIDNTTPAVDLEATPTSGDVPLQVRATVSAYQARGVELEYQLDFGDGSAPVSGKIAPPY